MVVLLLLLSLKNVGIFPTSCTYIHILPLTGNVPLETMEQHVFRTYEAKYGLRSIAVEHAGALLRSLLKHSSADNEVRGDVCVLNVRIGLRILLNAHVIISTYE